MINVHNSVNEIIEPLCAFCHNHSAKYTCPRCSLKSCSLQCSRSHKIARSCSGVRDRGAFTPVNRYGWGKMVDDYVYLEEAGRKVGQWGQEIVRGGLGKNDRLGRGGRGRRNPYAGGDSKRDFLSLQLGFRDIDMDVLPSGMEKHRLNQSSWDYKNKMALLTIEFIFHLTPDHTPGKKQMTVPISLLTHRNRLESTLRQLLQDHVKDRIKSQKDLTTFKRIGDLVCLDEETESESPPPLCVMRSRDTQDFAIPRNSSRNRYHKFDWRLQLSSLLRLKHFVEFPTIEVTDESLFEGVLVGEQDLPRQMERKHKCRRLDVAAGKKAIRSLLGDYGSDEENQEDILSTLGRYGGSDQDALSDNDLGFPNHEKKDGVVGIAGDGKASDREGEEMDREIFQSIGNDYIHDSNTQGLSNNSDEEDIDWGDESEDETDEAKLAELLVAID